MGDVITLDEAVGRRIALQASGRSLVFTNGHFDLLHVGHLDYLEKARGLGGALYVGVNGDATTTQRKGSGRPIVPATERARLLAALVPVECVIIFEEATADELLRRLKPEIYVKGGDYKGKPLPEKATVRAYGGRIFLVNYMPGHSTTELIARVKALP